MDDWASDLARLDADDLFLSNDAALGRYAGAERAGERLTAIALDEHAAARARVNAAELIVRRKLAAFPPPGNLDGLARAYAVELKATIEANSWSMPGRQIGRAHV